MSDAISKAIDVMEQVVEALSDMRADEPLREAIAGLQALQSGEPVGHALACGDPEVTIATFNADRVSVGTKLYTTPPPVVPEGYVLVPKTALDGALYLAGLAVAHTDFGSQHRADFKVCCDALLSAGKGGE